MHAPLAAPSPGAAAPTPPPPPRRRPRFLRNVLIAMFVLVGLVLLAPMSIGLFRSRIEEQLSRELRTPCKVGSVSFSWFSGFEIAGVEIGNAQGFDSSHPFLRLHSMRGDVGILSALRGRFDISGVANGLQIWLDQDEHGRTNAEALAGIRLQGNIDVPTPGQDPLPRPRTMDLGGLRLDLELTESGLEIRRAGQLLESLRDLTCRIEKEYGTQTIRLDLGTRLAPTAGSTQDGELQLRANVNAQTEVVDASLTTRQFDLSRYLPLAAVFLQPGELTVLAGIANGALQLKSRGTSELEVGGDLQVTAPRLAGSLVHGMDLRAERWSLVPRMTMQLGKTGELPRLSTEGLHLDLGFLQVNGLAGEPLQQALAGKPGFAADYTLDLDRLATFGGPLPEWLRDTGGKLVGTLSLPIAGGELPPVEAMIRQFVAQAQLTARSVRVGGFELANLAGNLTLRDGDLALTTGTGTLLNAGAVTFSLTSKLHDLADVPIGFDLDWQGGKVAGQTAQVLRYAVPLLAGLPADGADFSALIDLKLGMNGPARPGQGESWWQFVNRWSGNGTIALRDGAVTPAAALQGLVSPLSTLLGPTASLGDGTRLSIDQLTSGFTMRQGTFETKAMRWLAKGRELGLAGKVGVDGKLDFGIDLTALLQQHRDGRRIAAALGNKPLQAGLAGTLDAPTLGLPDVASLLQSVLQNPGDLLKDEAGKLLQKGLEDLFGKKKQ